MKMNLGSSDQKGIYRDDEWVCVDLYRHGKPNVQASGFSLPFADNCFEEVRSVHVLEHLSRDQWPIMLQEMFRTLKVGGTFYVEVPDFPAQIKRYLEFLEIKGDDPQINVNTHIARTGIWGKSERPGMGHQFGFDRNLLARALMKTGFQDIRHLTAVEDMISGHYGNDDPVLLFRATKTAEHKGMRVDNMSFNQLRSNMLI